MGGFVSPETGYVCAGALKARVFTEFLPECGDHLLQYHNFYYSKILEFQSILETLTGTDWHPHVAAIIQVERSVATRNPSTGLLHQTNETAFYVANRPITAARAA
ncbi:MAG: hypothetical protein B7X01_01455 [Acidiphilium sp. 21-62-4]|nr:MAG: hypothetical protein B7X01_01455 [Acidiphilium sp. 21-62-4]